MSLFSDRLISLRKERGLTQYDFAKNLKMSRSTISGYETEGKEPSYSMLRTFAEYFGVSADYLLGLSDERTHVDVVFQKDLANFKKHYEALPFDQKPIVTEILDNVYTLIFRDVCAKDASRLETYRDLFAAIKSNRADVRRLIEDHNGSITDASLLSPLMAKEDIAKSEVGKVLDQLMQSDLQAKLHKDSE